VPELSLALRHREAFLQLASLLDHQQTELLEINISIKHKEREKLPRATSNAPGATLLSTTRKPGQNRRWEVLGV